MTILSIDGIGPFDHVFRGRPFVRKTCAKPSCLVQEDQHGVRRWIWQPEAGGPSHATFF